MYKQQQQRRRSLPTLVVGLIAGALIAGAVVVGLQLGNPFHTSTVDRSVPPVLIQLRDLADYHASQGQFEVTVDQERDVKWIPSAIAGERVQYVAVGSVDAVVDFAHLTDGAVELSDDGKSVTVTLPAAYLTDPVLDRDLSHVMNRDRGIINRISGVFSDNPTSEQGLEQVAADKIGAAAAATDLRERAEQNTRSMLESMFHSLGIAEVDVRFQETTASVG
jgi:hypothetical protein